jgi:hypothetical protein
VPRGVPTAFIGLGTRDRKVSTGFSGSGSELGERIRPGYDEEEGTARGVGMSGGKERARLSASRRRKRCGVRGLFGLGRSLGRLAELR